jgi:putative transposase
MTRKPETIAFWTGRLPHWEVEGGRYFITIHLAGAIPAAGRARIRTIAKQLLQVVRPRASEWLNIQRAIFVEMERWLDRASYNTQLERREVATMVADAIAHREERGDWQMHEYVIMPTHVHLFYEIGARGLKATLEDFKRWTGHRAAELSGRTVLPKRSLELGDAERSRLAGGTYTDAAYRFWQREWFDHWSRSDAEDERIAAYIRRNPEKAGLVAAYQDWPYGSWRRK